MSALRVDVWSDVVCPWCYIGKRRLEGALGRFEHAGEVEIHWHSFQLDPSHARGRRMPVYDMLAAKTGAPAARVKAMTRQVTELAAAEGLEYHLERAVAVNTVDAHRLNHLAEARGLGAAMHERLLRAHLCEGETVDDRDTLARLGAEVGVPEEEVREMLAGDGYLDAVAADGRDARRYGAGGVPYFVLNRAYAVSGAQSADTFLSALRTAYANPVPAGR